MPFKRHWVPDRSRGMHKTVGVDLRVDPSRSDSLAGQTQRSAPTLFERCCATTVSSPLGEYIRHKKTD